MYESTVANVTPLLVDVLVAVYLVGGGFIAGMLFADRRYMEVESWKDVLVIVFAVVAWPAALFLGWVQGFGAKLQRGNLHISGWNLTWSDVLREHGRESDFFEERWTAGRLSLFRAVGRQR